MNYEFFCLAIILFFLILLLTFSEYINPNGKFSFLSSANGNSNNISAESIMKSIRI
jgi:hypothetical protein